MSHDEFSDRRHFLKLLGAFGLGAFTGNPFDIMSNGIARGLIQRAMADATGTQTSKKYLSIYLPGAPARFAFDQWLKLKADETLIDNPFQKTKLVNGVATTGYFEYNGILTPHLFSQSVNVAGTATPISQILKNMLVIRGFATGTDGHTFNAINQQSPLGGAPSMAGFMADHSAALLDAVQFPARGGNGSFTSHKGKSSNSISINEANPVRRLMEGFLPSNQQKITSLKDRRAQAIDLAQRRLQTYSMSSSAAAKTVAQNLVKSKALIKQGISDVDSYWPDAVNKYRATIYGAMQDTNISGISDHAITTDNNFNRSWGINIIEAGIAKVAVPSKGFDIRKAYTQVKTQYLAESLAAAEYLFMQGYSDVFEGMMSDWIDLDLKYNLVTDMNKNTIDEATTTQNAKVVAFADMHETGINAAVLNCNSFYRGLVAGLMLFIKNIGPQAFNNTAIQIFGDFGRTPRASGSGSDHGFNMMTTSVISGMFNNGPFVVGDILRTGYEGYDGTIGLAAKIDGYPQDRPNSMMATSCVAALMKYDKNPWANLAPPLINLVGDQLQFAKGYSGPKIKDGGW